MPIPTSAIGSNGKKKDKHKKKKHKPQPKKKTTTTPTNQSLNHQNRIRYEEPVASTFQLG